MFRLEIFDWAGGTLRKHVKHYDSFMSAYDALTVHSHRKTITNMKIYDPDNDLIHVHNDSMPDTYA